MTKAEVIAMIKEDYARAEAKRDKFQDGHGVGDFTNQMYYEGEMFGLKLALMSLEYLDES